MTEPATTTPLRRDQILNAAATLFRRRGYHAVGIDDIGAEVGVSGPAVYRHFPSKQALLESVIAAYVSGLADERRSRAQADPDHEHVLDAAIAVGARLPDHLVAYNRELRSLDVAEHERIVALGSDVRSGWVAYLRNHGVEHHSDAGTLRLLAIAGVLLHTALTRTGSKRRRAALAEELVDAILDCELGPFGPSMAPLVLEPIRHVTTREALLSAASTLFHERDFTRVSLRDIGATIGLSASAVSRHFESKDQLLVLLFERANAPISASLAVALRSSSTPAEAARGIARRYVNLALDFRDLISINATQLHVLPPPQRQIRIRSRRMYIDELANTIQLADPGMRPEEARLRAGSVYSLVNEVVMHPTLWRIDGIAPALTSLSHAALFPLREG